MYIYIYIYVYTCITMFKVITIVYIYIYMYIVEFLVHPLGGVVHAVEADEVFDLIRPRLLITITYYHDYQNNITYYHN